MAQRKSHYYFGLMWEGVPVCLDLCAGLEIGTGGTVKRCLLEVGTIDDPRVVL